MIKAIILLSGGLDSTTCLAIAHEQSRECHAMTFLYGQRAEAAERRASHAVAQDLGVASHAFIKIDPSLFEGASSLTSADDVPRDRSFDEIGEGIPSTYVPARNTIFLSMALARAEVVGAREIWIGANAIDCSGYPDCTGQYLHAFEKMARQGGSTIARLKIIAPLIAMDKKQIIARAHQIKAPLGLTSTCYTPDDDDAPCETCDACRLRARGFERFAKWWEKHNDEDEDQSEARSSSSISSKTSSGVRPAAGATSSAS